MTDKRSRFGHRASLWIAALSTVTVAVVIGCGGGGAGGGSLTGSTSSTSTSSTSGTSTSSTSGTSGSPGTPLPGTLPSNVIFYGDGGSSALVGTSYDVHYISPDGTGDSLYVTVPPNVESLSPNPSVSGQYIFAATSGDPTSSSAVYGIYSNTSLSLFGAKTIASAIYPNVDSIVVSPDGNYVVFAATDTNDVSTIYRVQISGGTPAPLFAGADPTIDATGKYIVFDQYDATSSQQYIWKSNFDGSGAAQLTTGTGTFDSFPQFSKQSDRIAFERYNGTNTDVYTIKADGTNLTAITSSTDQIRFGPSWSPDGTLLSFYTEPVVSTVSSITGLCTATSTPASTIAAPTLVKSLVLPEAATYWTGNNGRSTAPWRLLQIRRKRALANHKKGTP